MKKAIAFFDFDGTITTNDTLLEFIRFYRGGFRFALGFLLLSPVMVLMKLGLIPNWRAKEWVMRYFFGGESLQLFNNKCTEFASSWIPKYVRPQAMEAIRRFQSDGIAVVVVSASPENWVKPWCEHIGVDCLATVLTVSEDKITGTIHGRNCYGDEKVKRIRERYDLSAITTIYAFGDTSGDKPMLALANKAVYKPFREKS